jgi:hypothetical protein
MGSSPSVDDQKQKRQNNINKPPSRNVQNGRQRVIQRNANNRQLVPPIPRPLSVYGGLPIGNYVVVRVPVYYAPQALYYVQQSPMAQQVYVSPSNVYTPVAVSHLPQIPVSQGVVPQYVVPQVAVPQVAVAQRPVVRVSVPAQEPQVSILRVEIPQVSEVAQEPKVMVSQPPSKKEELKENKTPMVNRESDLISDSLSYESSEEEESTSSDYSSDSDDYVFKDEYPNQKPKEVRLNEQIDLQANDDLAYAFQLEDLYQDLSTFASEQTSTSNPSPIIYSSKPQEDPLSIDEILHLYREGEPVIDYINFYVAVNPNQADNLAHMLENEVSGQSILQNVQQYYQERDPFSSLDEEFTIDYLTPSDDEGQENWSYED